MLVLLLVVGAIIQRSHTPGRITQTVALTSPPSGIAIDTRTGRAFVPLMDGHVAVLTTRTGRLLHVLGPFSLHVSVVVDTATRRAFLDGGDGTVTVVDARNGHALGTTLAGGDGSVIAVDERHSRVIVTNPNGDSVDVLDARSGRLEHTLYLGLGAEPRDVALDTRTGHVFVVNRGAQTVSLLDPATGTSRRVLTAARDAQVAVDARAGHALVTTTRGIVILDVGTGHVLATVPVRFAAGGAVVVTADERDGRAFVGDGQGVRVLDTRSGRVVQTLNVAWGALVVDERLGRAFLVDDRQGTLNLLDARRGSIISTISVGVNPSWPVIDDRAVRLYIASTGVTDATGNPIGNGTISVVDTQHGTLVRTISAGVGPVAIALDGRTSHAFIANTGGMIRVPDPWSWMPVWLRHWTPFLPAARSSQHRVPGSISMLDMAP